CTAACGGSSAGVTPLPADGGPDVASDSSSEPNDPESGPRSSAPYADVNPDFGFTHPVWLPPPATTIVGDTIDLIGSWIEMTYQGMPCTPATPTSDVNGTVCTHLDIERGADGGVSGTLYRESSLNQASAAPLSAPPSVIVGPFATATDPNVGYPT